MDLGKSLYYFALIILWLCFAYAQVWNASNGHLLNKLEPVEENEVTGIISLPDKSKIITVGWNRKILVYYDDIQVGNLVSNVYHLFINVSYNSFEIFIIKANPV